MLRVHYLEIAFFVLRGIRNINRGNINTGVFMIYEYIRKFSSPTANIKNLESAFSYTGIANDCFLL